MKKMILYFLPFECETRRKGRMKMKPNDLNRFNPIQPGSIWSGLSSVWFKLVQAELTNFFDGSIDFGLICLHLDPSL